MVGSSFFRLPMLVGFLVVLLVASACSSDENGGGSSDPALPSTADQEVADFNRDGSVRIAVVTEGSRDDGAYYQALVERVQEISSKSGYEPPLIVDQVDPANARAELNNVVDQGADIIAIGSSNLADGNEDLFLEHDEIFWYCNCGSGYQDHPGLFRSADSGAELGISAGYATGLLLSARNADRAVFLGCCDLNFEVESFLAFRLGLQLVDDSFTVVYVPTGNFPFDFNNTAGATEAYNTAVAEGMTAVYPFLGGAHEPIIRLANQDGLIAMTAGSSRGCERTDLEYDIEVRFDAGDYLEPELPNRTRPWPTSTPPSARDATKIRSPESFPRPTASNPTLRRRVLSVDSGAEVIYRSSP